MSKESSTATGLSSAPVIVTVTSWVLLSEAVTVKTSATVSPAERASVSASSSVYVHAPNVVMLKLP